MKTICFPSNTITISSFSLERCILLGKDRFINSVNLNSNTNFPYLVLNVVNDHAYPRNPGFQVMHWHEDLQFIYVIEGKIDVRTLDVSYKVTQGEAFLSIKM